MARLHPQCLLFLVRLIFTSECKADPTITASASQDQDAVIPCFNSTVMDPKGCYRVRLVKYATDESQVKEVIFAWPKNMQDGKRERVKWERGGDGKLHFYLKKVQKSDEGLYSCEVCKGWDCTPDKNISLKVKDCTISQAVKAAPRTSITLNCPAEIKQGAQNVSWQVLKGGNPSSVNAERVKINGTSLIIRSVDDSDSGWFRCQYLLTQSQRCFDINLIVQGDNVQPFVPVVPTTRSQNALTSSSAVLANKKQESSGAYIAIVASVITGTVVIAALIGFFIYRRRNTPRVAQQAHSHPAGYVRDSFNGYEIVVLTSPRDPLNQQANVIYQHSEDNMCTFQY